MTSLCGYVLWGAWKKGHFLIVFRYGVKVEMGYELFIVLKWWAGYFLNFTS